MSRNNTITVTGRVGTAPELRGAVARLRLAVNSYRKKKDAPPGDRDQYETNWFTVIAFRRLHDAATALSKGDLVTVTGSVELSTWEKDGIKRESVEIHAEDISMADARPAGQAQPQQQHAPARAQQAPPPAQAAEPVEYFDDDVPF